jgi:hypothetical protein
MATIQATLLASHQLAHSLVSAITDHLPEAVAEREIPGAALSRITPILAHAVLGEDMTVNHRLRGEATVLERNGGMASTGIPGLLPAMTPEWRSASYSLEGIKDYMTGVFATTEAFLATASAADFERMVRSPIGSEVTGAELLSSFNLIHLMIHAGEISALKGVQGVPGGLPF